MHGFGCKDNHAREQEDEFKSSSFLKLRQKKKKKINKKCWLFDEI